MLETRPGRFVVIAIVILVVAFPLAVVMTPPDPYTQAVVASTLLVFVLPVAYLLSHPTLSAWLDEE